MEPKPIVSEEEALELTVKTFNEGLGKVTKSIEDNGKITSEISSQLERMAERLDKVETENEKMHREYQEQKEKEEEFRKEMTENEKKHLEYQEEMKKVVNEMKSPGIVTSEDDPQMIKAFDEKFFLDMRIKGLAGRVGIVGDTDSKMYHRKFVKELTEKSPAAFEHYRNWQAEFKVDEIPVPPTWTAEQKAAYTAGSFTQAGVLIMQPRQLTTILDTEVQEISPMRQLSTVERISVPGEEFPTITAHAVASRTGETATRTVDETLAFGKRKMSVSTMYVYYRISHKQLEDSAYDLPAIFNREVGNAIAVLEGTECMTGSGVGEYRGILTGAANGDISYVATGVSASMTNPQKYINLIFSFKEAFQNNLTFQTRRANIPTFLGLMDGTGQFYANSSMIMTFDPATKRFTIMGMPVYMNPDIPAWGASAYVAVAGDMKKAYKIIDKPVATPIIVDVYTLKSTGYIEYLVRIVNGGDWIDTQAVYVMKAATS